MNLTDLNIINVFILIILYYYFLRVFSIMFREMLGILTRRLEKIELNLEKMNLYLETLSKLAEKILEEKRKEKEREKERL